MTPTEIFNEKLVERLHAAGVLSDRDLISMASDLNAEPADGADRKKLDAMASNVRAIVIEAGGPSESDVHAEAQRVGFRVIDGGGDA